jgi:hypothetical protein
MGGVEGESRCCLSSRHEHQLHRKLDAAVLKADEDLLDQNLELAEREEEGLPVVGPWDPNRKSEIDEASGQG